MATLKLHPQTDDMDSNLAQALGEFAFEGALLSHSATSLRVGFPDEVMVFTGRGFDFTIRDGAVAAVNSGTLTRLDYYDFGVLNLSVTGLSINGPALFNALVRGDFAAVHTMFFGKADLMQLSNNADEMRGFGGNDTIFGYAGDDTLDGGTGNDLIYGGAGRDRILGDAGGDTLRGGDGDDAMFGGSGVDLLYGDAGNDQLYGGDNHDRLFGGAGNDRLYGDSGNDQLRGDAGNDQLYGGLAHDALFGGSGNDRLEGGSGNDTLRGDGGKDTLLGGTGHDELIGGAGQDVLTGGTGADVFVFAEATAGHHDRITDFVTRVDKIRLDSTAFTAFDTPGALSGDDFVLGTAARDASDHLIYQRSTGRLWYDADGSGAGAKVLIAQLNANANLVATDILIA